MCVCGAGEGGGHRLWFGDLGLVWGSTEASAPNFPEAKRHSLSSPHLPSPPGRCPELGLSRGLKDPTRVRGRDYAVGLTKVSPSTRPHTPPP